MQEPRIYDIADIHEDVLQFLLNFREEEERQGFYFLLRPNDSERNHEALKRGWWFGGNETFLNLFFVISQGKNRWQNNFQLSVSKDASWHIKWEVDRAASDWARVFKIAEEFMAGFSSLGKYEFKEKHSGYFLEPFKKHYRDGLPEALNIIEKFLQQDRFSTQEWLRKITPEEFQERLDFIQNLRGLKNKTILKGVSINSFHGIKETKPPDLPETAPWIFLTGENGFGKTSVLQALAIGLYGNTEDPIIPKNGKAVIEAVYQGENKTRTFTHINNIRYPGFFRPVKTLACYGPSRLQLQSRQSQNEEAKNATATYSLFNQDGNLKNIEFELLVSFYDNHEKFLMLEQLLKRVVPSLHKIELEKKERRILYFEKEEYEDSIVYEPVSFDELASGIRGIIAMVGDIYLRLSDKMERQNVKKETASGYYQPEELGGIVIIDELDLHLHPKWQKKLPALLSEVFPNVQFIAATHSPIPLLGAPEGSMFLKVNRTEEEGITIEKLDIDIRDFTPNLILTSKIFGFTEIFPITHDPNIPIRTEDTQEEAEFTDKVVERLKSLLGTEEEEELSKLLKSK